MVDLSTLQDTLRGQVRTVEKRVKSERARRKKQVDALRQKAANAALQWVMAHQSRVGAFRRSVRGTPVAKALDALLRVLRTEARRGRSGGKRRKPAARRK